MSRLGELNGSQALAPTFSQLRTLLVAGTLALGLTACGGGGGSSDSGENNGGNGNSGGGSDHQNDGPAQVPTGTPISEVEGIQGDADYQGLLFYTMTTDSEEEPDPSVSSSAPDRYKLVAVNPQGSSVDKSTISTNLQTLHGTRGVALSFPKADIDASTNSISNYHMDRILFQKKIGSTDFQTKFVETDSGTWPPTPLNVNGDLRPVNVTLSQYDLQNPDKSVVAYGTGSLEKFHQTHVENSAQTIEFVDSTAEVLTPSVPLMNGATHQPEGWLAFSADYTDEEYRLLQYDIDGTELGEVKDENNQPVVNSIMTGTSLRPFPGGVFADNSQLVVLELEEAGSGPYPEIYKVVYQFIPGTPGQPGSLKKLLNSAGEALKLPSINSIPLRRVAISSDAVYLAMDTSGNNEGNSIYRLDQNGWEELLQTTSKAESLNLKLAGRYLVWTAPADADKPYENSLYSYDTANDALIELDYEIDSTDLVLDEPAEVVNLGDPVYGNADGSIYYGRKRAMEIKVGETTYGEPPYETTIPDYETRVWVEAVVRMADGSGEPVIIKDATWIAASTNGNGPMQAQVTLAQLASRAGGGIFPRGRTKSMELSEVFFIKGVETDSSNNVTELVDPALYAISAGDPAAGMVKLGDLPADTRGYDKTFLGLDGWNDITGEMGAGPHRLLTIERPDFKNSIIYVNTRQKNSLKVLDTSNGDGSPNTAREVRGF